MNKRIQWLKAYKITLEEYKDLNHSCMDCAKCKLLIEIGTDLSTCYPCPESIFDIEEGCTTRIIKALSQLTRDSNKAINNHEKALIKYHEKAVVFLEKMKKFNLITFQNYLLKIDKEVAKEFNLK